MRLLENKVAIVTGASSGIGAAIAEKFVEEGAKVTMLGRNQTKLANVAQRLEKKNSKPLVVIGDVTNEDDCRRVVKETVEHFGKLDILVNNAGIACGGDILDENIMKLFDKVLFTNFRSVILLTHLAVPHVIKTKGNIINISSIAGKSVYLGNSRFAYACSKAALDHFTRCIAVELSVKGVRVNAISPGSVKTDMIENMTHCDRATSDAIWESMRKGTLLNKIGEPEEIADLAVFLASDKARSVTGSVYVSDNGALLKGRVELHCCK